MIRFLSDTLIGNIPSPAGVYNCGMTFFLSFKGYVATVAAKVGDVAKNNGKALVKPFYEKNFTEFLLDLKNGQRFFIFPRHSETHFELENSEFRCEMNF